IESAFAPVAILECVSLGGQRRWRTHADGGLRLERPARKTFRGSLRAENRGPLVFETNADRGDPARYGESAGADLSRDQEIDNVGGAFVPRLTALQTAIGAQRPLPHSKTPTVATGRF